MVNTANSRPLTLRMQNNALISLLIAEWLQHSRQKDEVKSASVAKAVLYLHQHLADNTRLKHLAEKIALSPHHFSRLFKQETELSVGAYVRYLRMRRAQVSLMHTAASIKAIASDVGYEDYNYFIRMFKKETGMPPAAYRPSRRHRSQTSIAINSTTNIRSCKKSRLPRNL